jgi:hypothetical protein
MTLLLRDPDAKAGEPSAPAPSDEAPEVRACPTCQTPLEAEQDWCLSCGAAQPGRPAGLPGRRAAATVLALTAVLVGGAVAASYAALQDGSQTPAATPTQIAQVPAPAPAPSATAPAPTAQPSIAAPSSTLPPATTTPKTSSPPAVGSTPVTPPPSSSGASTGSTGTSGTSTGSGTTTTKGNTTADTRTSTTPADTGPVPIKVSETAATLYDPFKRDTAAGDPAKALDGDPNTSFPVTVAAGSQQIGAGLTVDLGKQQGLREIDVTTKTPGFKIEIYATNETDLPPDVLDTRWAHLKDVTGVGTDTSGKEKVALGSGTSKYRHVLLWFTAPPTDGSTVRVSELKVLG